MRKYSVTAIARHRLAHARSAPSGRSAETVYGGTSTGCARLSSHSPRAGD